MLSYNLINMTIWLNIYAKDVQKLADFYQAIGFQMNPNFKATSNEASIVFDHQLVLMIFKDGFFQSVIPTPIVTPKLQSPSVLFSIELPSIDIAENMVQKAIQYGGKDLEVSSRAKQKGFYNTGFIDPEGHLWNILVR